VGKPIVLDTSVLIEHERSVPAASQCISELLVRGGLAIHPVTRAELVAGARSKAQLVAIRTMISSFSVLAVKNADFIDGLALFESNVLASGVGWPDCLIAATCRRLGATLITLNDRDFRICPGLKVVRPF